MCALAVIFVLQVVEFEWNFLAVLVYDEEKTFDEFLGVVPVYLNEFLFSGVHAGGSPRFSSASAVNVSRATVFFDSTSDFCGIPIFAIFSNAVI